MTDSLEVERLDSEQLLDGLMLKVFRDKVRQSDGTETEREWIDHPGAAAVVPLFEDGKTLLVRQYRYAVGKTFLEVPAGKLDHEDEAPEEVAARELEEETGWTAGSFTHLASLHPTIGYSNEIIHYFIAEDLSRGTFDPESGEQLEPFTMPFQEVVERALQGEISDMKSFVGLLLAWHHIKERKNELKGKKLR